MNWKYLSEGRLVWQRYEKAPVRSSICTPTSKELVFGDELSLGLKVRVLLVKFVGSMACIRYDLVSRVY